MSDRPILAAFDQGKAPTISCVNKATIPLGVDFGHLVPVMQRYINRHFAPIWGTPAHLIEAPELLPGTWAMVFMDDADVAGALGYHDLTPDGFPLSKVFVRTTINDGDSVSVTATHELTEMLVDPATNLCAMDEQGVIYAYETADSVEETSFWMEHVLVSNFVYPAYFEGFRAPGSAKFDYLNLIQKPFELLAGGYSIIFRNNQWGQIFGSQAKAERFAKEDRRHHRSERRKKIKV